VSVSGGTRLLGLAEASGEEILGLIEQKKSIDCSQLTGDHDADNCNIIAGFSVNLVKVDCDGPSLELRASFSLASFISHSLFHQVDVVEDQGKTLVVFVTIF
jgi:hypothetical protein